MLRAIVLQPPFVLADDAPADFLEPIAEAARQGTSVGDALANVVRALEFEWFTYGASSVPSPSLDSRTYVWTNLPPEWIARYDAMAYLEVDPRATEAINSATPITWDRDRFAGTAKVRAFFDDAARFGVRSGVALGLRDQQRARAGFWLSSSRPRVDPAFHAHCEERLGEIVLLAHYVHAMLTANVVDRAAKPPTAGLPLSARELECLRLAAKGLGSPQIATELGISERTVHFHFGNLLAKLDAKNRQQAISIAVSGGLVQP